MQKIRRAFEMKYLGRNEEEFETWLRNIIVLIPKKKVITKLEGRILMKPILLASKKEEKCDGDLQCNQTLGSSSERVRS